jgi:hypothetical protein
MAVRGRMTSSHQRVEDVRAIVRHAQKKSSRIAPVQQHIANFNEVRQVSLGY